MEDVIKHIMQMDQRAYDKKLQTEKQILQQKKDFEDATKILSQEIVDKARLDAERNYAVSIENQIQEIKNRDIKTIKGVEAIKLKYKEIEEKVCEGLFKQIFSMEE